jgi:hypothetical protein
MACIRTKCAVLMTVRFFDVKGKVVSDRVVACRYQE